MKLTGVEQAEGRLSFKLANTYTGFANAIRRLGIGQVPIFAIESVTMYENTSSLFDEYIANRLCLVPLSMAQGYGKDEKVMLSLDGEGPGTIYSRDLRSHDRKIQPVHENIPIMKLAEGQKLRLEATAVQGVGRLHAKFQPGIVTYGYDEKEGEFKFHVESFGQLSPVGMLATAADTLIQKCDELEKQLDEKSGGGR